MTRTETESSELLNGYIVAVGRGSQLRVRLEDGREIRAIPLIEALQEAKCPKAIIFNRACTGSHVQASETASYRMDRTS